ncbi:MAG: exodeoxyribonuclease VII small subunit [Alistipes sp.]|nr:exodeoxyribonuclease VII small subunit [Alistipes sp.]MBR4045426.1 exodeoxyribonuclease VII small subunit [Alistipes sp.]
MAKRASKSKLSYSEAIAELESILQRLRSGELGIEELTTSVKRAKELIELCKAELTTTKTELDKIINDTEE